MCEYIIKSRTNFPNWVGDHYEQTNLQFARTLPDSGFYLWFGPKELIDNDAMYFMGNEL